MMSSACASTDAKGQEAGREAEAGSRPSRSFQDFILTKQQSKIHGMLDDNTQNENENRAPQPHVPECDTQTHKESAEETIKRMRAFPERAAKLREAVRAIREANTR